jgi:hypothetical protein
MVEEDQLMVELTIKLVNDLLQTGYSPALPSSSISASSFDLNNYRDMLG